jgi:hypothetical protein
MEDDSSVNSLRTAEDELWSSSEVFKEDWCPSSSDYSVVKTQTTPSHTPRGVSGVYRQYCCRLAQALEKKQSKKTEKKTGPREKNQADRRCFKFDIQKSVQAKRPFIPAPPNKYLGKEQSGIHFQIRKAFLSENEVDSSGLVQQGYPYFSIL